VTNLVEAQAFVLQMRAQMPLLNFMQVEATHWDGQVLTLSAPLEPNRNDKNTAFAGSIASLSTVTGWALLMLWCQREFGPCQVAVYHAELRYRHPITDVFKASAHLPNEAALEQLRKRMASHGKGRIDVQLIVHSGEQEAVTQTAGYAIWTVPY